MNEESGKKLPDHLQGECESLAEGAILESPGTSTVCGTDPCNAIDQRWGTCPLCHRNDGYHNVGNDHWFLCHTHKTKWAVGANLFSSATDETPEQQHDQQERIAFDSYEEVEPHYDTTRADEESDGCHCFRCENSDVKDMMFGDPVIMRTFSPDDPDELEDLMRSIPKDMSLKQLCEKLRVSKNRAVQMINNFLIWNDDDAMRLWNMSAEEIESEIGLWAPEALCKVPLVGLKKADTNAAGHTLDAVFCAICGESPCNKETTYWGVCPVCHASPQWLIVGAAHWCYCLEHQVKWFVGESMFSSWMDETNEEQKAEYDALDFGSYVDVHARETGEW